MIKPQTPETFGSTAANLWAVVFLTMIFRDLHEMSTASTLEGILHGTFEGNPVTDAGLVFGGAALILMISTAFLSTILSWSVARWINRIMAAVTFAGLFYIFPNDPDDYLLGGATACALIALFALSWRRGAAPEASQTGADHVG